MEFTIYESQKRVDIWLSRAEASSEITRNELKPVYAKYKAQGYRVVVFASGQRELFAATRDLLLENRIQREPQQSMF